jgi:hypothetical protein
MSTYLVTRRTFMRTASAVVAGSLAFPLFVQGAQGKGKKDSGRKGNVAFDNYSGHYSLRGIVPVLKGYRMPSGKVLPEKWVLKYDMHICMASRSPAEPVKSVPYGTLQLEKDGDLYRMTHTVKNGQESVCTETSIRTAEAEAMGWTAKRSFVLQDATLKAYEETAELAKKTVKLSRHKKMDSLELSAGLVSFPQLVSAMMKKNAPLLFAFLDEQCGVREEQHLKEAETISVTCASGSHALSGFHQHGRGMHPVHYWLDERGAPVFVTRGLRSYVLAAIG